MQIEYPISYESALHICRNMRPEDVREIFATKFSDDPEALAHEVVARKPFAWAAGLNGEPIALFGCIEMWPGVWEVWMFATPSFDKIGRRLTRLAHSAIVPIMVREGCRRIQAHSIEGHDVAHRWLETLGAVREAELPDFGKNGETFYLYRLRTGDAGMAADGPLSLVPLLGGS